LFFSLLLIDNVFCSVAKAYHQEYLQKFTAGPTHNITRQQLFTDMIDLYRSSPAVNKEFPFTVEFKDEQALDTGGVVRESFSAFW